MNGKDPQSLANRPKPKSFPPIKVLFPSLATVDASELKREVSWPTLDRKLLHPRDIELINKGGGTMFVGSSWKATTKHLFHDANSKSGGVLMHAKVSWILLLEKRRMI